MSKILIVRTAKELKHYEVDAYRLQLPIRGGIRVDQLVAFHRGAPLLPFEKGSDMFLILSHSYSEHPIELNQFDLATIEGEGENQIQWVLTANPDKWQMDSDLWA